MKLHLKLKDIVKYTAYASAGTLALTTLSIGATSPSDTIYDALKNHTEQVQQYEVLLQEPVQETATTTSYAQEKYLDCLQIDINSVSASEVDSELVNVENAITNTMETINTLHTELTDLQNEIDSMNVNTVSKEIAYKLQSHLLEGKTYDYETMQSNLDSLNEIKELLESRRNPYLDFEIEDFFDLDLTQPCGFSREQYLEILPEDLKCIADALVECDANGFNGLAYASIACLESDNGTSGIARDKNNIIGWRAYDRDARGCAESFVDYSDCVYKTYPTIIQNYLNETGCYYHGANLSGMNVKYCTNPDWYYMVADYMNNMSDKIK